MVQAERQFRRGFKTQANDLAHAVRRELKLRPLDALSPTMLADHLGIPLLPLTALRACVPEAVEHFC